MIMNVDEGGPHLVCRDTIELRHQAKAILLFDHNSLQGISVFLHLMTQDKLLITIEPTHETEWTRSPNGAITRWPLYVRIPPD